jgi:hypothetical protein
MYQLVYRKVVLCTKHVYMVFDDEYLSCEHVFDDIFNQFMSRCLMIIA